MAYSNDPIYNAVDRIRLLVGDTHNDVEFLDDGVYEYLLNKHKDNETRTAVEAAQYILGKISRWTRERAGEVEVYGGDFFKNYSEYLNKFITNPSGTASLVLSNIKGYVGGVSVSDMRQNRANPDNIKPRVYRGFIEDDGDDKNYDNSPQRFF